MMRWSPVDGMTVFRQPSNFTNGHTRDLQGRLVSCEHGGRRITRTEPDGAITVLADNYQGKRFNSPNDLVVKSDGTIWFTDPPYGILSNREGYMALSEIGGNYVYRLDPETGEVSVVVSDMEKPNGLAFSPDERILYVADSALSHDPFGNHNLRAYDVVEGSRLTNSRIFAEDQPRRPRRLPAGRERLSLHQFRRQHSGLQPGERAARQDHGSRKNRQLHLRRGEQRPAVHRRQHVDLRHRPEHAGHPETVNKRHS